MTRFLLLTFVLSLGFVPVAIWAADPKLELIVQTGHTTGISSVSLSGDGKLLATGSEDNTTILWNVLTGEKLSSFEGHLSEVRSVSLSADGKLLGTSSWDGTAILWDTRSAKKLHVFRNQNAVSLCRNANLLATGAWDRTAIVWDTQTGKKLRSFLGHSDDVNTVSLSADGKWLASGSRDKTAIVWDVQNGKKLRSVRGHTGAIRSVSLSGDGELLATGSEDKTAIVWEMQTGRKLQSFAGHTAAIRSVSLSGDGKLLATGSEDETVMLWDTQTGKKVQSFQGSVGGRTSASLNSDGKLLAMGSWTTATVWEAKLGKKLQSFQGHTSVVSSVGLSGNEKVLAAGSEDGTAILWDAQTGKKLQTLHVARKEFASNRWLSKRVSSVSMSRDGKLLTTESLDSAASLWDTQTGKRLQSFGADSDNTYKTVLSGDGKLLATGSRDKTATLWDARTGKKLQTFSGHTKEIFSVSLSGDGKMLATGSWDKTAILWDTQTGEKLHTFKGHAENVDCVSLSDDGRSLATGSADSTAIVWDTRTGKVLQPFLGHTSFVECVDLNGDGELLATGCYDKTAILWNAKTGKKLQSFLGHAASIRSVCVSANGRVLVTGSEDGTTRLWDTQTGKELCKIISVDVGKDWLVVTPDGLFDGSPDATQFLSYRIAGTLEFVPLERFQQKHYQPGLLRQIMEGKRPTASVDIARCLPPKVRFVSPEGSAIESKDGTITVRVSAVTPGFPIKKFHLLYDGRPYSGQNGIVEVGKPELGETTAEWKIKLDIGRARLKVLAETEYVTGATEEIEVVYRGTESSDAVELPDLYVLAIGISKYPGTRKLDYAHRDAQSIAETFKKSGKPLFKSVNVKLLTDEQANYRGMFNGLRWLNDKMTRKSVGVFFFAGHGERGKDGSLYFLPQDVDDENLAASAIDAVILKKQLAAIPGRLTVILDVCHSGGLVDGKERNGGGLTDLLLRDLTSEANGLVVMCSALGNESARESREHEHGSFTQALLEGLSGRGNGLKGEDELKIGKTDGAIYMKQLDAYVTARVRQLSKGYQNPVTGGLARRDFPISKP